MFYPADAGIDEGYAFYMPVDIVNFPDFGRKIDPGTFMWWLGQSAEARDALASRPGVSLPVALRALHDFICDYKPDHAWANSPDFDFVILERAARACGEAWPLKFYNYRCVRTARTFAAKTGRVSWPEKNHAAHNALADAIYQAKIVQAAFAAMR